MLILKTPILLLKLNIVKKSFEFCTGIYLKKISLMIELIKLIPRVQMLRILQITKTTSLFYLHIFNHKYVSQIRNPII